MNPVLTDAAIQEIKSYVAQQAKAPQDKALPIPIDAICANKELIMGFLKVLVALIPGWLGKIVGQAILAAAEAWFASNCKK